MNKSTLVQHSIEVLSNKISAIDQDIINAFLESHEDEKFDDEHILDVINLLERIWSTMKYGFSEGILFSNVIDVIMKCEPEFIKKLTSPLGILITQKDIKKGKHGILTRVLRKYHRPKVREHFSKALAYNYRSAIAALSADPIGSIEELNNKYPFESLLWIVACYEKNDDAMKALKESYPRDYAYSLWYCLIAYVGMEFEVILDSPEKMSQDQSKSLLQIQDDNKKLQKNLQKAEKKTSQLQRTVHEKEQTEKELLGKMHALYEDALKETEELRNQIVKMKQEHEEETLGLIDTFQEERAYYEQTIENLRQLLTLKSGEPAKELTDLQGRTIAVVGGNRERHYRDIVERYNGVISFVPENQFGLVHGSVMGSDAVFFIRRLAGHDHWRDALNAAKTAGIPFIYVNTKGVSTFERELVRFMKQSQDMGYRIQTME